MEKQKLENTLRTFNSNFISKKNIEKYFSLGDKFNNEEMDLLLQMLPFDKTNCISIKDFVDFVYDD